MSFKPDSTTASQTIVVAVVLTFRNRVSSVLAVLAGLANQVDLDHTLVIYNGSEEDSKGLATQLAAASTYLRYSVNATGENLGSGGGYAFGLDKALDMGATHVLLLDDDNVPNDGAVRLLLDAEANTHRPVLAFRTSRTPQRALVAGTPVYRVSPGAGSFMYFDLLSHVRARVRPGRPAVRIELPYGPYGGLLLTSEMIKSTPPPRRDFVLYEDDTEWTSRLVEAFGSIILVPEARIGELTVSATQAQGGIGPSRVLAANDPVRVYYAVRNRVWFDHARAAGFVSLRYQFNKLCYLAIILLSACRSRRTSSLKTFLEAVRDAESGCLGQSSRYRLEDVSSD